MDIALEVMQITKAEMSVSEILKAAQSKNLFNPDDWGKTPAQTLYSSFLRESKLPTTRIRKSPTRGHWFLVSIRG